MSNRVRTALIIMVSIVWAANFTAPIFVRGYEPAEGVHVAFMAVVGILTSGYSKEDPKDKSKSDTGK